MAEEQRTYQLRLHGAGSADDVTIVPFRSPRDFRVGDPINTPVGPDGIARAGHGFVWLVTQIDDHGLTFDLVFDREFDAGAS